MIETAVDALGDAVDPWGYLLLFVLCLLEASAFVGLFIPGETALLIAGVLAQEGRMSLALCIVVAVFGAVLGDTLGYEIGRHVGPRLRSSWFGRKVGEPRWDRAHDYVHHRGGFAIFFGRFIGVLRAVVPAIAGDARMRYRDFVVWNVLGALVAIPAVILVGYVAGSSYQAVEARIGQASYLLLALVAGTFIARVVVTKRRERREESANSSMTGTPPDQDPVRHPRADLEQRTGNGDDPDDRHAHDEPRQV
ncbi:MAG TPA: DedA family protein [Acidimicrobiales bacterium]|jgi:membrane protein DedA with SNARE-associated domain|nr:DedA family protein [Acidimicrobiales bacterium]